MIRQKQFAMLFHTMHQTMEAEEALEDAGLKPQWLHVPADLGLGYGMALTAEDPARALAALQVANIKVQSLWQIMGESWHPFSKETR